MRSIVVILLFLVCACGTTSSGDGGTGGCPSSSQPECVSACGSDFGSLATCVNNAWSCDKGVPRSSCPCNGAPTNISCPMPGKVRCTGSSYVCDQPDAAPDAPSDAPSDVTTSG